VVLVEVVVQHFAAVVDEPDQITSLVWRKIAQWAKPSVEKLVGDENHQNDNDEIETLAEEKVPKVDVVAMK
jgi:hypothetical protein